MVNLCCLIIGVIIMNIPAAVVEAALYYVNELGFSVIPIKRDKKPLIPWKEYQTRRPSEEEIERWWSLYPDANIAVVTGEISNLVVVDVDNESALNYYWEHYPRTSVHSKTARGFHFLYRHPGAGKAVQNGQNVTVGIDIRGDGGYIAVYPSIHATGVQYEWVEEIGFDGFNDLPAYPFTEEENKPKFTPSEKNELIEQVITQWMNCSFMNYFYHHQNEQSYDCWMAILTNTAKSPLPVAVSFAFSEKYPGYSYKATGDKLLSAFDMHPYSCSFIKRFGQCGGCSGYDTPFGCYSYTPPIMQVVETVQEALEVEIPPLVLNPGGILQEIMEYTQAAAPQSYPLWDLGAALCLLGAVGGQKVCTPNELCTNLYILAVGNSGTGKTSGMNAVGRILDNPKLENLKGASTFTSPTALLRSLSARNVQLMLVDEIGDSFKMMRNPNSYAAGILALLKEAAYKTNSVIKKDFASKEKLAVHKPHLSLYGATTPNRFWGSMTIDDAEDGLLARFIILESAHMQVKANRKGLKKDVPNELIDKLLDIKCLGYRGNNGRDIELTPLVIPFGEGAAELIEQIADRYVDKANAANEREPAKAALFRRGAENVEKIALIHALSLAGGGVDAIKVDDINWADIFVDFAIRRTIGYMNKQLVSGGFDDQRKKFLRAIAKVRKSDGWAARRDILRFTHASVKEFDGVVETLIESGHVLRLDERTSRGKITYKYAIPLNVEKD
jgi:hypothetical protein